MISLVYNAVGEGDLAMNNDIRNEIIDCSIEENTRRAKELIEQNKPMFLYKYRVGNDYDIDALKQNKIWISRATEMDDEEEGKLYINKEEFAQALEIMEENDPKFRNSKYRKTIEKVPLEVKKSTLICSFSEICDNEDMWNKYANQKRGFCIEYKFDELFREEKNPLLYPVAYIDEKPIFGIKDCNKKKMVFLTLYKKTKIGCNGEQWLEQKEWRYACFEKNLNLSDKEKGCLISVSKPTKIYFGKNSSDYLKMQIKKWVSEEKQDIELIG